MPKLVEITDKEMVKTHWTLWAMPNLFLRSKGIHPGKPYTVTRDIITHVTTIYQEDD